MSRAHRGLRAIANGVRRRGGVLTVMALLVSCAGPDARIASVSVTRIPERTGQSIALGTTGCTPSFDLDRGLMDSDPTASLRLGGDPLIFQATRTGFEAFTAMLPDSIPPGTYPLELVLTDGRHAPFDGHIEVTPQDPSITAVTSARSTIGFGEAGIPLSVTVANPSACAVDGLVLAPTFHQSGALQFDVHGPAAIHLDPTSVGTFDFTVDLGNAVIPGPIQINAMATSGTRSGLPACTGSVDAADHASDAVWIVVPAMRQSITVTALRENPHSVPAGGTFVLSVTVQNDAGVDLSIERIDVLSDPAGVTLAPMSPPLMTPLPTGSSAIATVTLRAPEGQSARLFTLAAVATARDGAGALYASPAGSGVTTTVMIRSN